LPSSPAALCRGCRHPQVDCVATFLLSLYKLTIERGDEAPLIAGWSALAAHLANPALRSPHHDQLRWHPRLAAAIERTDA
jgi:hypothetical protein